MKYFNITYKKFCVCVLHTRAHACALCGGHSFCSLWYNISENIVFEVDAAKVGSCTETIQHHP
jgi:hypothetical protein